MTEPSTDPDPRPSPGAALIELVTRVDDPTDPLSPARAVVQARLDDLVAVLHPSTQVAPSGPGADGSGAATGVEVVATGLAASPGVARGVAMFDTWRALDAFDQGLDVVLVRPETSPADEPAMGVVAGVVTSRGGMGSHAAVIARGRGLPAVCGAHALDIGPDSCTTEAGLVIREGDLLAVDGSRGEVARVLDPAVAGSPGSPAAGADRQPELPAEVVRLLGWADDARAGHLAVLANADVAGDAVRARSLGAQGIGLCRTEHQFLASDRLALLRRLLLAGEDDTEAVADAQDELVVAQQHDFEALLEAMDGLVVTVRLLDPPLHEFLPDLVALERDDAAGLLDPAGRDLLAAARRWHEHNPMLGVRGVRLAVLKPDLYRMQIRALLRAAAARRVAGGDPRPRLLIPLVSDPAEVVAARGWVAEALAAEAIGSGPTVDLAVGAMVETPRAALLAGPLAEVADFLSFGTNDLTQLTFGLGRDESSRLLEPYRAQGLLADDPFATLDRAGVGALVARAAAEARAARPRIALGLCGEHGGDPASIAFGLAVGLDSVSCSPFRVPVARLAAAQAVLG